MKVLPLAVLGALLFSSTASAGTINVPADQSTIQAAINAANNGDTVLVAPGTYYELIDFKGKAITVKSSGGASVTILDGNNSGPIVTFDTGEGNSSVLQGFTLTHALTGGPGSAVYTVVASPTIEDNIFTDNAESNGYWGCTISGDTSSPIILRNYFSGNTCGLQADDGVIGFVNGSSPVVADNVFANNTATAYYQLIPTTSAAPKVYNNTIVGNAAGLVLSIAGDAPGMLFSNNLIAFNQIGLDVSFLDGATLPTWTNNLVWGNTSGNSQGTADGINGNIYLDPSLRDWQNGDIHLLYASPALDGGDSTVNQVSATDFYGDTRVFIGKPNSSAVVDIGAAEYEPPVVKAVTGTQAVPENIAQSGTLGSSSTDSTEPLAFTLVALPTQGTVTITNAATGAFKYTPTEGYLGTDSFTFNVTDPYGTVSSTATEQVIVRIPIAINVPTDYGTIQAAIDASVNGDTVLVAPSTYYEKFDFIGKAITVKSSGGAAVTILDGNNGGPIVHFHHGEGNASVLQGFTLTHAQQLNVEGYGPAVDVSFTSPTIEDNVFVDNVDDIGAGSAIAGNGGSPVILRNYFTDNSGVQFEANPVCVIGLINQSSPVVADNVFANNSVIAYYQSGSGAPKVYNNTMVGNSVGLYVSVGAGAGTFLSNNIIAFNQIGVETSSLFHFAFPPFNKNLVYGNNTADYQVVPSQTGTSGNISSDPKLKDWAGGDVHLLYGSPAIDAGDSTVAQVLSTDFYDNTRVFAGNPGGSAVVDIGAVEYESPGVAATDGLVAVTINIMKSAALGSSGADSTEPLVFALVTLPVHGSVTLTNSATGAFQYVPAQGYLGSDSFTFHIMDPYGTVSNIATEQVTVVDPPPTANDGSVSTVPDTAVTGALSATAGYVGQKFTFSLVANPAHGTVSLTPGSGKFSYTPATGYAGADSFTFEATDSLSNASNVATESVTVTDRAPKAQAARILVMRNQLFKGNLPASTAYAGQVLSYGTVSGPSHGTLTITNALTGAYTYKANQSYKGKDSFTFQVVDQWGTASNVATVTVSVL